jgi:hypothetical protein
MSGAFEPSTFSGPVVNDGVTALMRMPYCWRSKVSLWVKSATAALAAL